MGQHVWLLLATIGTEMLAITKWSQGQFPEPLPRSVRWAWAVGATLLVLYPTVRVCGVVLCFEARGQLTGGLCTPLTGWASSDSPRRGGICDSTGGPGRPRTHRHEDRAGPARTLGERRGGASSRRASVGRANGMRVFWCGGGRAQNASGGINLLSISILITRHQSIYYYNSHRSARRCERCCRDRSVVMKARCAGAVTVRGVSRD